MKLKAIAALGDNRVIGVDGKIPWRLSEDMQFFKKMTTGDGVKMNGVLMGRKTWDSIGRRNLPNRKSIVLTRSSPGAVLGADETWRDVKEIDAYLDGLKESAVQGDVWVIGGAQIYELLLPRCGELYLTHVNGKFTGDTFFPPYEHLFAVAETIQETPAFRIVRYIRRNLSPSVASVSSLP